MNDADTHESEELQDLRAENSRLRTEVLTLRQFIDSMQNLTDAVERPRGDAEMMLLLRDILVHALQAINAKDGSLLVLDEDTGELVFILTHGDLSEDKLKWRRLPPGKGIAGWVAQNRRATIVNDARKDERFYDDVDKEFQFRTDSVLAAPIVGGGRVLGVIEVLNKSASIPFHGGDQTLLTLVCRFAGELLHTLIQQTKEDQPVVGTRLSGNTVT